MVSIKGVLFQKGGVWALHMARSGDPLLGAGHIQPMILIAEFI